MSELLDRLGVLVGDWDLVGDHPMLDAPVHGRATFSWLDGPGLLVQRTTVEHPDVPDNVAVIGADGGSGEYTLVYTDVRDVQRVYRMALEEADGGLVWRQSRDAPGFAQRFTGTFDEGRTAIDCMWQLCVDGITWNDDLEVAFTKVG
ncbi:hypothetical protein EV193_103468 [Herbihabitans rhizosphaerae]|uniref:DUF1579 domain-containing protein n=1 Tax=Herbihabitans rhizosphaerae TaxID=1872711 RepID=A0A4Q7KVS0_9PSEU|nr:hypothetical protein [Herbihabitans rhizosphaerae]RZS41148.1 hypothetical protein EV193_103468 [Herbihabitans rhizosphaerae]